jgi:hypothetical protein
VNSPPPSTATRRPPLSKRWTFAIVVLTLAFVLMPFLFWRATWFGRPLSDAQLADYLNPKSNPHDIQHGLSQVADRIIRGDAGVKQFYPQLLVLASNSAEEIRTMDAWVMGQDNTSPDFHAALLRLLHDPNLIVDRNAALALVRFRDTSGRPVIVAMLRATPVASPYSGVLETRLKPAQTLNPGTLLAHIQVVGDKREVRSEVPGTLGRWLVSDGATVAAGQPIAAILPSDDMVWEALRALYLIGTPDDLDAISPYARAADVSAQVAEQARLAMQEIRRRAASAASAPSSQ